MRGNYFWKGILFCFLLFSVKLVFADIVPIDINSGKDEIWVHLENCEFYEDTSDAITPEQVLDLTPIEKPSFRNTNRDASYWIYFEIVGNQKERSLPWRVELFDFYIDEIDFYNCSNLGNHQSNTAGYARLFDNRELGHKNSSFLVPPFQDTLKCLMRFKAIKSVEFKPVIRTYDRMFEYALTEYLLFGVFYGLMILMIFYNLLYFVHLKKPFYLYYIFFGVSVLVYLMSQNGTGFQYLWPNFPQYNILIDRASIGLSALMMLFFTGSFFNISKGSFDVNLLKATVLIRVAIGLLEIWIPELRSEIIDVIIVQIALLIGLRAFRGGRSSAKWFVIAFCALDVSFIINFLEHVSVLPSNIFTVYSLYLGIVIQFVYLSVSIAESHKEALKERNKVQEKLIEELSLNEELKQKVNEELEQKVHERTIELQEQKEIIEEKNKNILDSVRYAENIQRAALPSLERISSILGNEYFVYYQPRDIVSGDFYWIHELNDDEYLIAAVDCTGHGVPGAFMSMIGINLLHRIISNGVTRPAQILNELHAKVQDVLNQRGTNNHDGMDLAICRVDRKTKKVYFAGAKSPMVYFLKGDSFKLKGDRGSIGGTTEFESKNSFTEQEVSFSGTTIRFYLFSDGYVDQFGGDKGKKIMTRNFITQLESVQNMPLAKQGVELKRFFNQWKGVDQTQLDDVMVLGVQES